MSNLTWKVRLPVKQGFFFSFFIKLTPVFWQRHLNNEAMRYVNNRALFKLHFDIAQHSFGIFQVLLFLGHEIEQLTKTKQFEEHYCNIWSKQGAFLWNTYNTSFIWVSYCPFFFFFPLLKNSRWILTFPLHLCPQQSPFFVLVLLSPHSNQSNKVD